MGCEETKEKIEDKIEQMLKKQRNILMEIKQEKRLLASMPVDGENDFVVNVEKEDERKVRVKGKVRFSLPEIHSNHLEREYYFNKKDYLSLAMADERLYEQKRAMALIESDNDSFTLNYADRNEYERNNNNDIEHHYRYNKYSNPHFNYHYYRKKNHNNQNQNRYNHHHHCHRSPEVFQSYHKLNPQQRLTFNVNKRTSRSNHNNNRRYRNSHYY